MNPEIIIIVVGVVGPGLVLFGYWLGRRDKRRIDVSPTPAEAAVIASEFIRRARGGAL